MEVKEARSQSRSARWGWGIVLVISGLMLLNGVGWFFGGPASSLRYTAKVAGMTVEEYRQLFPEVAAHHARTTRQVAVWYAAFGAMAVVVARGGYRHGTRWAWNATWAVPAAPIAIGLVYTPIGQPNLAAYLEGAFLIGVGIIALIGKLLSRPR